jgi:succinate dehydrogenase/fumarate reductase flavoprotein subunit
MVTGYRAGESAAKYSLAQQNLDSLDEEQARTLKGEIYAPLKRKQGVTADEIRLNVMKAWVNIDLRNEINLQKAREAFIELEKEASNAKAKDLHELTKHHKLKNYIQCAQAVAEAALIRRESRLDHYRDDYPLTDNKNWLKWVITQRTGNTLHTSLEDIPIAQWTYKPEPTVYDLLRLRTEET